MEDQSKTKEQVIEELKESRLLIRRLQESILKHKQAVIELQENEESYQNYFSAGEDVLFSYDRHLNVLSVSPNVEQILGYKPEDLTGKNFTDLLFLIHSEDEDRILENAANIFSGKPVHSRVYRYITKDGRVRYGETNGVPIMRDGQVKAMASLARDVTERIEREKRLYENEKRYRRTLDSMPDAVGIVKISDSRCRYVNEEFCRLAGYRKDEIIADEMNLNDLMEDYVQVLNMFKEKGVIDSREQRLRRKDKAVRDILVSARPIQYSGEDCMLLVGTDITALKIAEEERKRLEFQSQKMDSIATLARGIGHDFNNILTTIIGYTKMTMKNIMKISKEEQHLISVQNELKEVRRSALRAKDLVDQLLWFSRHTEKTYVPIDLSATVRESLKMVRPIIPSNIRVQVELQDSGMVRSDPARIHQIMMNLCTNAVHAMHDIKGELEIRVSKEYVTKNPTVVGPEIPEGSYLKLTVKDNGCGMPPRVKSRIFDPYFTTKWKGEGTGMGLSIVHGIVKSHGGTIACTSSLQEGTTFEIYLPEIQERQEPCMENSFKVSDGRLLTDEISQRTCLKAVP